MSDYLTAIGIDFGDSCCDNITGGSEKNDQDANGAKVISDYDPFYFLIDEYERSRSDDDPYRISPAEPEYDPWRVDSQ